MREIDEAVQLALMSLYLAAMELEIPTGMAFFGANDERDRDRILEVAPPTARSSEAAKALIAGFNGRTHNEFLYWGLLKAAEALHARPERRKVLLVLHDGDPVFEGPEGDDLALSQAYLRKLERQGLTVIGVYLGDDEEMIANVKRLFPRLVICQGQALPETLGNLLRGLV